MKSTMMAIQKPSAAPGAKLITAPVPKPGPLDVLIEVKATSICGTDLHIYEWDAWAQNRIKPPLIFGHEMAGEIIEVGSHVTGFEIGDHVSAETHIACGTCFQCRTGNAHICEKVKILGVDTQGVFAEYVSLPAANAWKNPKNVPHDVATAQEPLGNAVHTVFDGEVAGQTIAIFGCGPIGVCAAAICKAAGADKIFAVDLNEYRLKLAKEMGADVILNPKTTDVVKEIKGATDGRGVDVFLEMSGAPAALSAGLKAVRVGGRASILGVFSKPVEIDISNDIVFKALKMHGINGRRMYDTWYKSASFLRTGKIDLAKIVTHKFNMSEYEKGFEALKGGNAGKVVLYPGK